MKAISNIPNWHRYLVGSIITVQAVLAAIIAAPKIVPPALEDIVGWAPFVELVLSAVLATLPRVQLATGPGAPDIESPPLIPHG